MPLLLHEKVESNALLWLWKIEEEEDFFLSNLCLSSHDSLLLATYSSTTRRLEWLAARLLVMLGLGENLAIGYSDDGKPHLVGRDGYISISHSGPMVGLLYCSVSHVGLDIERISDRPAKIARRFMQEQELELVDNDGGGAAITRAWASKEALFKVLGQNCYTFRDDFLLTAKLHAKSLSATFFVRPLSCNQIVFFMDVEGYSIAYSIMQS